MACLYSGHSHWTWNLRPWTAICPQKEPLWGPVVYDIIQFKGIFICHVFFTKAFLMVPTTTWMSSFQCPALMNTSIVCLKQYCGNMFFQLLDWIGFIIAGFLIFNIFTFSLDANLYLIPPVPQGWIALWANCYMFIVDWFNEQYRDRCAGCVSWLQGQ